MAYLAIYRKYRPVSFDKVIGQQHIVKTLTNQIKFDRVSHAYLFTGTRGTGKTSAARIFARAINCLHPVDGNPCNECAVCKELLKPNSMDIIEIDAASNNGVDAIRDLREKVGYMPSVGKYKVYIIDEVHMLSISAFNALLKIIEEPPEHLLFILATTELHKVPATILSRCQRFSFRRISQEDIAARLQYVSYQENIDLEESAARVLARMADGGMRDAMSLLDQVASATTGELTADKVYASLGIAGQQKAGEMMGYIARHETKNALALFNRLYADGKDLGALLDELACLSRDLLVLKTAPDAGLAMLSGVADDQEALALSREISDGELVRMMNLLQQTMAGFTRSASRRMDAELCLLNLCQPELSLDAQALNARLTKLEEQIRTGSFVAAPQPAGQVKAEDIVDDELPPPPDDADAPPMEEMDVPEDPAPVGFWTDLAAAIRQELRPPVSGFFAPTPNAPVQGVLQGNGVVLRCANDFTVKMIDKPEILEIVSRKAATILGRAVAVKVVDASAVPQSNQKMEQLLSFGRAHSDVIKIKE